MTSPVILDCALDPCHQHSDLLSSLFLTRFNLPVTTVTLHYHYQECDYLIAPEVTPGAFQTKDVNKDLLMVVSDGKRREEQAASEITSCVAAGPYRKGLWTIRNPRETAEPFKTAGVAGEDSSFLCTLGLSMTFRTFESSPLCVAFPKEHNPLCVTVAMQLSSAPLPHSCHS